MLGLILIVGGIVNIIILNKSLDKDAEKWRKEIEKEKIRIKVLKSQERRNKFLKSKHFISKTTHVCKR